MKTNVPRKLLHLALLSAGLLSALTLGHIMVLSACAADGTPVWTNLYNGPGNSVDQAYSVVVDGNGNVFVTGNSKNGGIPPNSLDYATIKYSDTGIPLWTNRYNGPGNGDDMAYSVAVDGGGNAYVTGISKGTVSGNDFATIKYSNAGVSLWTNRYNGPGNTDDQANQVALDSSGNVYVMGQSTGFGSGYDWATIKYSTVGAPLWTNRFNGSGSGIDQPLSMALDGDGNVLITGNTSVSGSGYDYATIKYSNAGVPLWTNFYAGPGGGDDVAYSVAVDGGGNVYVTGFRTIGGGTTDYATIKYSAAGVPLWTNFFDGPIHNFDYGICLAVDSASNAYVSGRCTTSSGNYDYATIKYSDTGIPLWTNKFRGSGNSYDGANALALDGVGNVYVTGQSTSTGSGNDYATIKYSPAGLPLWTNLFNGAGNGTDSGVSLAVDGGGNVYVTGYATGSGSGNDYATIKYSGPPPVIFVTTNGVFGFANNQFIVSLVGPVGSNAMISASSDLLTWIPLVTNPLTSGTLNFTDLLATNYPSRYYRANLQ